jgi:putative tryptophan/tyrosine transport system substrate-binding protein
MKRRAFVTLLGGAAAAWPLAARAQPAVKTYRIGFLGVFSFPEYQRLIDALRTGLRQLGYEEGKNIVIVYRWAEGRYDRLPELASELVKLNVDVIVTHSTPAAQAAKQATSTIPIVFAAILDPTEAGLVSSLHRPGGNLTGLTFFLTEISAKRVELIKEAIPALTRLAVLVNPLNPYMVTIFAGMQHTASALGVELFGIEIKERADIAHTITAIARGRAPALVVIEEPLTISNAPQIADFALQSKLPMIGFKPQAEAGALMDYGADLADLYSRSASFVDKILKGVQPADLPVERAVKFELSVNLQSAKKLDIKLPASLLIRADRVIE